MRVRIQSKLLDCVKREMNLKLIEKVILNKGNIQQLRNN